MDQFNLTIGKLSDQTGVKIETIRYYRKNRIDAGAAAD